MKIYFLKWTGKEPIELESLTRANLRSANLAGADLAGADLTGADLTRADLTRANLTGADLTGANLRSANLAGAYLAGAYLAGAYLAGAYLAGADLAGANLASANLTRADLGDQWIIQGAIRSDGYQFFLQQSTNETEPRVKAGCRYFTLPQAWEHWRETRANTSLGEETFAILTSLESLAKIRGYMK